MAVGNRDAVEGQEGHGTSADSWEISIIAAGFVERMAALQADLKVRLYEVRQPTMVGPAVAGPHDGLPLVSDVFLQRPASAAACAVVRRDQMKGPSLDQLG
jgi:hypothetical protein